MYNKIIVFEAIFVLIFILGCSAYNKDVALAGKVVKLDIQSQRHHPNAQIEREMV